MISLIFSFTDSLASTVNLKGVPSTPLQCLISTTFDVTIGLMIADSLLTQPLSGIEEPPTSTYGPLQIEILIK